MNETSYRGYDLEQKELLVGWQITITMDGRFVRNSSVAKQLSTVLDEAKKFVDGVARKGLNNRPDSRRSSA